MSLKSSLRKPSKVQRRSDRRNKVAPFIVVALISALSVFQLKQLRANKRHEVQLAKRCVGVEGSPPHLIVVAPLSPHVDSGSVHSLLCEACEGEGCGSNSVSTVVNSLLKQRFTVVLPPPNDLYALLDVAMVTTHVPAYLLLYNGSNTVGSRHSSLGLQELGGAK